MKKQLLSCGTALCLLLGLISGCGKTTASSQEPSVSATEASASVLTTSVEEPKESVVETSTVETSDMPEDPAELGAWLWGQTKPAQETITAEDVDMDMTVTISTDSASETQSTTARIKEIISENGAIEYQVETEESGLVSKLWYQDGMAYYSDADGKFKAPMNADTFAEDYANSGDSDMMELNAEDFETITGTVTDSGYTVTFSGVNAEACIYFDDLFNGKLGDMGSITNFDLSGEYTMNKDFQPVDLNYTITVSMSMLDLLIDESIDVSQHINALNEAVSIKAPSDDESFREISDLQIPTAFITAYQYVLSADALDYSGALYLTISDGNTSDEFLEQYEILYRLGEDRSLTARWMDQYSYNGMSYLTTDETYADGTLTYTANDQYGAFDTTGGAIESYAYAAGDYFQEIVNFTTYYGDAVYSLTSATMTQDGQSTIITLELPEEYVASCLMDNLDMFSLGISFDDASDYTATGSLTLTVDTSGTLVKQYFTANAEITTELGIITLTCQEGGDVVATGDSVSVNPGY